MDLNVNNLVRSGVILVLGLPVSLAATFAMNQRPTKDYAAITQNLVKAELTDACLKFGLSKADSKLERDAKTSVDEVLGGDANYQEACRWALS